MKNYITPGHIRAYQAVTSRLYDNITLWSCRINNEPGVAIVMVDNPTEDTVAVMPLFVAITPGMRIEFQGACRSSAGSEGGPSRHEFSAANEEVFRPAPH